MDRKDKVNGIASLDICSDIFGNRVPMLINPNSFGAAYEIEGKIEATSTSM